MSTYKTLAIVLGMIFFALLVGGIVTGQFARRMISDTGGDTGSGVTLEKLEFYFDNRFDVNNSGYSSTVFSADINGRNSSQRLGQISIAKDDGASCNPSGFPNQWKLPTSIILTLNNKQYKGHWEVSGYKSNARIGRFCNMTPLQYDWPITGNLIVLSTDGTGLIQGNIENKVDSLVLYAPNGDRNRYYNTSRLYLFGYKITKI